MKCPGDHKIEQDDDCSEHQVNEKESAIVHDADTPTDPFFHSTLWPHPPAY